MWKSIIFIIIISRLITSKYFSVIYTIINEKVGISNASFYASKKIIKETISNFKNICIC